MAAMGAPALLLAMMGLQARDVAHVSTFCTPLRCTTPALIAARHYLASALAGMMVTVSM